MDPLLWGNDNDDDDDDDDDDYDDDYDDNNNDNNNNKNNIAIQSMTEIWERRNGKIFSLTVATDDVTLPIVGVVSNCNKQI